MLYCIIYDHNLYLIYDNKGKRKDFKKKVIFLTLWAFLQISTDKIQNRETKSNRTKQENVEQLRTRLSGDLHEGVNSALSVVSLRGKCWHVVPAQSFDDVQHGLSLVRVRRNHPREEVVPIIIAEFWSRWCIAHLRDLNQQPYVSLTSCHGYQMICMAQRSVSINQSTSLIQTDNTIETGFITGRSYWTEYP